MGLFGFGKKRTPLPAFPEDDMDIPPKPPEFHVEGPVEPTSEELQPITPLMLPAAEKPTHTDDLSVPGEHLVELPPLEPIREVQQAIVSVQQQVPHELPDLTPLTHEEYELFPQPAPPSVRMPSGSGLGESVLIRDMGPLFVTMDGYERVVTSTVKIRADLQQAEDRAVSLNAARAKEDTYYGKFQQNIEQVERKLAYMDRMLFGAEE